MDSQPFDYYRNKNVEYDYILKAVVSAEDFINQDELLSLINNEDFLAIYFPQVALGNVYTKFNYSDNKITFTFGISLVDSKEKVSSEILKNDIEKFILSLNKNINQEPKLNIKKGDIKMEIVTENKDILNNIDKKLVSENKLLFSNGDNTKAYLLTDDGIVECYKNAKLEDIFSFSKLGVIRECKQIVQEGYTLLNELDGDLKDLNNAINYATLQAKSTGFNQYIYVDEDGNYSYSQVNDEKYHQGEKYVGKTETYWENSMLHIRYIPAPLQSVTEAEIPSENSDTDKTDILDNPEKAKEDIQKDIQDVEEIQQLQDELDDKLDDLLEEADTSEDIFPSTEFSKKILTSKQILDTDFKECLTNEQIAWITKHYGSFDEFEEYFKQFATIVTFDDDLISVDYYLKAMQDGGVI